MTSTSHCHRERLGKHSEGKCCEQNLRSLSQKIDTKFVTQSSDLDVLLRKIYNGFRKYDLVYVHCALSWSSMRRLSFCSYGWLKGENGLDHMRLLQLLQTRSWQCSLLYSCRVTLSWHSSTLRQMCSLGKTLCMVLQYIKLWMQFKATLLYTTLWCFRSTLWKPSCPDITSWKLSIYSQFIITWCGLYFSNLNKVDKTNKNEYIRA